MVELEYCFTSITVLKTGRPRWVAPPLRGETPPTILVPYAMACSLWKVPWGGGDRNTRVQGSSSIADTGQVAVALVPVSR